MRWGGASAYYNDYRQPRFPTENLSLGRNFRVNERVNLQVRAEFQNVFNRVAWALPSSTNAEQTQTRSAITGNTVSGFGYINTAAGSTISQPRSGHWWRGLRSEAGQPLPNGRGS